MTYLRNNSDRVWPKAIVASDFARIRITDLAVAQRETGATVTAAPVVTGGD